VKKQTLVLVLLAAMGLALSASAQETAQSSTGVTGEILKLDRDTKVIELKSGEDMVGYVVDESAVPGWYTLYSVGDVVTLTLENVEEQGERVVGIRKVRDKDDPK
jgi:hypothetical protein